MTLATSCVNMYHCHSIVLLRTEMEDKYEVWFGPLSFLSGSCRRVHSCYRFPNGAQTDRRQEGGCRDMLSIAVLLELDCVHKWM